MNPAPLSSFTAGVGPVFLNPIKIRRPLFFSFLKAHEIEIARVDEETVAISQVFRAFVPRIDQEKDPTPILYQGMLDRIALITKKKELHVQWIKLIFEGVRCHLQNGN